MSKKTTLYQDSLQNNGGCCNITIIGAGYVGLVTGTCLASLGHVVYCVDSNQDKIKQLNLGKTQIHEPGLSELITEQVKLNRLIFTDNLSIAINHAEAIFIAVGTPQEPSGKADLSYVESAIKNVATLLPSNFYKLLIIKSTVPVGTCRNMQKLILEINPQALFEVASNPEFLREGSAVFDFMQPERIVIGISKDDYYKELESFRSYMVLRKIYKKFIDENIPVLFNDLESSELIKYAANCFLSTKIAFINELADFCEALHNKFNSNVDILTVARAIGLDSRIGEKFLQPGPGFGGSCFPKDILALDYCAAQYDIKLTILEAVIRSNNNRIKNLSAKIINICNNHRINNIANKVIAVLGIAFKANTDDIRDSVAINVINDLHAKGAILQVYDPEAMENGKLAFNNFKNVLWFNNAYEVISGSEAVVILTEWQEFVTLDLTQVKKLMNNKHPIIIDFRNLFDLRLIEKAKINYYPIGRRSVKSL